MRLILKINFSGVVAYKSTTNFSFHFMVIISDEYKCKGSVKTTIKSCGKPMFFEIYHRCNCNIGLPR